MNAKKDALEEELDEDRKELNRLKNIEEQELSEILQLALKVRQIFLQQMSKTVYNHFKLEF